MEPCIAVLSPPFPEWKGLFTTPGLPAKLKKGEGEGGYMKANQVKICHLEEFVTLAETLSYTEAARKHYLSTSALSKHITALEGLMGEKLFVRDARSVELTDKGRRFYEGVQPIVEEYSRFIADFKRSCRRKDRRLVVCLAARPPYLVGALSDLSAQGSMPFNPMYVSGLDRPYERFLEDTVDSVTIMYDSDRIDTERFDIEKVASVPLVAVMPASHPLAARESLSFARDLEGQTLVKLRSRFFAHGWDAIETLLKRHSVSARSTSSFVPSSFELAILNGLEDILLIPEAPTTPLSFLESGHYRVVPFNDHPCFDVVVVWSKKTTDTSVAAEYASRLRASIAEKSPDYSPQ